MPNQLIHQTSPYLLQHAHNPVNWYPWGPEALEKARAENKVILVSIGYSACHWCHVMERESFENEETAGLMNRHFINIKIDREERPDLDQVYMDAVQWLSGSGGWPLNVFLTPDTKPFYGGTYFPPVKAYNRNSWPEVLTAVYKAWTEKPQEILSQAENLTAHLKNAGLFGQNGTSVTAFNPEQLIPVTENLLKTADTEWGGFGKAPKFPQTFSIQYLIRQYHFNHHQQGPIDLSDPLLKQALLSLDKMIQGGIYDQLGGGFARYSTDSEWFAPHFEKMLYDNALLVNVLSEAWQLTHLESYAQVIQQTMDFISQEWQDKDGGFFSAFDADSEGEEGKYYTWTFKELEQIIPEKKWLEIFVEYYGVLPQGNWEHTNILWVATPLVEFCKSRQLHLKDTEMLLENCRQRLLTYRAQRVKPLLDDKKLLGWNALMITACCKAWRALQNENYLQMAIKAAGFVEEKLKTPDGYRHNYKAGKAANPAFLEDLAYYIEALIHLQECTGNLSYLDNASLVAADVLDRFSDEDSPFFFFTPKDQQDILFRKKDLYDGATPGGNSVMAQNLFYLGTILDKPDWKERSANMVNQALNMVQRYPGSFGIWAQALQWHCYGLAEVAIIGPGHQALSAQWHLQYFPAKVFQQAFQANKSYPLLEDKPDANDTFIYICKNYSCKKPVHSIKEAVSQMITP